MDRHTTDEHEPQDPRSPDRSADQSQQDQRAATLEGDTVAQDNDALDPQEQIASLNAKLLRTTADYQNYVRRSQQNISDACSQQLMSLAKALVTPLDHFDHALTTQSQGVADEGFIKGVQIVRDELIKVLEQFDIKRVDVKAGEEFDPNRHEALQRVPAQDIPSGAIVEQYQPGYVMGQKTIRPAKVVVAE